MGCKKHKEGGDGQPGPGQGPPMPGPGGPAGGPSPEEVLAKLPGGEEFAAGKKVYADSRCVNCHKLGDTSRGGPPGRGGPGGGPDLSKVGGKPEHTEQWLAEFIRDPKSHRQKSRMPAFGPDKITDADLAALAKYLASQK